MIRRIIILLVIIAAIGGLIYYEMLPGPTEITLTGIVTTDPVIVSSQIQGRLDALKVEQGQAVKKGDLLAMLQPAEWNAQMDYYQNAQKQAATQVSAAEAELQFQQLQTQNQIVQAQANVAVAQAQVAQAQADQENTQLTLHRQEGLLKKGDVTQQDYDQARTANDAAKAHVIALQKQVDAAKAGVEIAKASDQEIAARKALVEADQHQLAAAAAQRDKAQVQLNYTEIHAPIDGIVDVRAALQGEVVDPAQAIVTIINPDDLWVRADVEETYIDRIHLGDKMQVKLPSGATREGTVFYKSADADFATQRDVSRTKRDIKTFEIRLRCDNKNRDLALGMTAYVTLPVASTPAATAPQDTDTDNQ
jgi:HlyD family secretion protein